MSRGTRRETERDDVVRALDAHRVVTICGPAGVGKTWLARRVARDLARSGRPVVTVELGGVRAADVFVALARTLDVSTRRGDRTILTARIVEALERRRDQVVVLDDADELASVLPDVLDELGDATLDTRFLVTARRRFAAGVHAAITLEPLPAEAAIELLRSLLGDTAGETELRELAAHLDGLPLAIELAARRAALLGVAALLDELKRGDLAALAPLERALAASIGGLDRASANALRRLATFVEPFSLAAAQGAVGADVRGALARLVEDALVIRQEREGTFRTSALVRALAEPDPVERRRTLAAHAEWLLTLEAAVLGAELRARRADCMATFDELAGAQSPLVVPLALAFERSLVNQGPPATHRDVLERALALEPVERSLRAALERALGRHHALRARHDVACTWFDRARDTPAAIDRGRALALSAYARRALGLLDDAEHEASAAVAIAREHADVELEALATQVSGLIHDARGDSPRALAAFEVAFALATSQKLRRLQGIAVANAATVELALGRYDDAERSLVEARAAFGDVDDRFHLARVRAFEAELLRRRGRLDEAEAAAGAALDEAELQGALEAEIDAQVELGWVALARTDVRRARRALEAAELAARKACDRTIERRVAALRSALPRSGAPVRPSFVEVASDENTLRIGDATIDLRRRGPLRRVLLALARHHESGTTRPLGVDELREAGWPGERMRPESATARVYMCVRRLRKLGLEGILLTVEGGYLLDPEADVRFG